MNEKGMTKVLHYELPYETSKWMVKTFCGKYLHVNNLAPTQDQVNCLICIRELKKYNEKELNI